MLIRFVKDNLKENIELLCQLSNDEFCKKNPELSQATIGEHMRHIIELMGCLLDNYEQGIINYDNRNRNIQIQSDVNCAISILEKQLTIIDKQNKQLSLIHNCFSTEEVLPTNYFRELLYNLEHSIHHQALIKVAVIQSETIKIDENFGVARSTIEYRKQCAQ